MTVEELTSQIDPVIVRLFVAAALEMSLGLEREWPKRSAGVRTFTLTGLLGGIAVAVGSDIFLAVGGLLVVVQAVLLGSRGLFDRGLNGRGDRTDSQDDAETEGGDESDTRRDNNSTADSAA